MTTRRAETAPPQGAVAGYWVAVAFNLVIMLMAACLLTLFGYWLAEQVVAVAANFGYTLELINAFAGVVVLGLTAMFMFDRYSFS